MASPADGKLAGKAQLRISLSRLSFGPGELVQGHVELLVAETVVCSEVVVTVVGKESAAWTEFVGGSTIPGSEKHKFLELEIIAADQEQSYAPGEYTFPLQFQLPVDAPSSFEVHGRSALPLESIVASSTYTVKAATSITGRFLEDVEAKQSFSVHAPHNEQEVHGLESSITGKVGTLAVFSKGLCHIEGSLEKDVFAAGETLTVQTSITNQSPKDMHAISLRLYEDITVVLPNRKARTGSVVISRQDYLGVKAGQLVKQPLLLPLMTSATQEPVTATVSTGTYVNWRYRLVIKCKYSLSHSVRLEFPIAIVSAPTSDTVEPVAEPHVLKSL